MRFLLPLPLPRRHVRPQGAERTLRSFACCCPLSHLVVVVANSTQLALMVGFLCMLLACLNAKENPAATPISWFVVFAPLWASDLITLATGLHELSRVLRVPRDAFASRRNAIIVQLNRLKGSVGVATFKFLLAMRQDGYWPTLPIVAACSPYFVAALVRLLLHVLKKPVMPPDGAATNARPMRPGTPFNPVHPVILMLACRADNLNSVTWTATFWPLWTVFALLVAASLAATVLSIGICLARDPPDRGQRALFFLCYAFLMTVTWTGLTFLIALAHRLDGNLDVTFTLIVGPLIAGYSLLLVFYLIFTIFLPPLLLRDLNAAALAEQQEEEDQEETGVGGVIEAVSQQLAPPVLVQQSSTLFKRMGNSQMFERFLPVGAGPLGAFAPASALPVDRPAGDQGAVAAAATPASADVAVTDLEAGDASAAGGEGGGGGGSIEAGAVAEYDELEKDIELWVRTQQEEQQKNRGRKARERARGKSRTAPAAPDSTLIPADVKSKLRRLIALKEQLAAAATVEAVGAYAAANGGKIPRLGGAGAVAGGAGGAAGAPAPTAGGAGAGVELRSVDEWSGGGRAVGHAAARDSASAAGGGELAVAAAPPEESEEAVAEAAEAEAGSGYATPPRGRQSVIVAAAGVAGVDHEVVDVEHEPNSPHSSPPRRTYGGGPSQIDGDEEEGGAGAEGGGGTVPAGSSSGLAGAGSDLDDDDDELCAICFTGPRDAVLLECGHGGICYTCARRCLRKKGRECPMCRAPVNQVVQIKLDVVPSSPQHTGVVPVRQLSLPDEIDLDE